MINDEMVISNFTIDSLIWMYHNRLENNLQAQNGPQSLRESGDGNNSNNNNKYHSNNNKRINTDPANKWLENQILGWFNRRNAFENETNDSSNHKNDVTNNNNDEELKATSFASPSFPLCDESYKIVMALNYRLGNYDTVLKLLKEYKAVSASNDDGEGDIAMYALGIDSASKLPDKKLAR
eukprot:Awhi_evm1s11604